MVRVGPGGHAMPRVARVRAGAVSCGAREARARRQGCQGVAWARAGGRARLGQACAGRGGRGKVRPQGVRRLVGRQSTGECGQGRGQEQGARVGEHLGSKGQLQDVVVQWLAVTSHN